VDEVFPFPELLATILFSGFFLSVSTSHGNSVAFAKQVLLAAEPSSRISSDLDSRLVRFIAIVSLAAACLLHYFSGRFGLFMNKLLAVFKILLLFTVFVAGVKASRTPDSGLKDFTQSHGPKGRWDGLAALVSILYSYAGYENANYVRQWPFTIFKKSTNAAKVAGEIRSSGEGATPARTLKLGAALAVFLVTILYVLVTVAYVRLQSFRFGCRDC
jgi:amino acid transporter